MPVLTLLAPGTPVTAPAEGIDAATVERAEMRSGADPLWYGLKWQDGGRGPWFRRAVRADRVLEPEPTPGTPALPRPPKVTVVAPGSACRCPMDLPGARVELVVVRPGARAADPPAVEYHLVWHEADLVRRASFRGAQVTEAGGDQPAGEPRTNRLRDLGRLLADQVAGEGEQ